MKMMKLSGLCACVLLLALFFCGKDKGTNPGGNQPGTVFDYSDTLALRAILDANGLTAIKAGDPTILVMTLVGGNVHRIKELTLINKGITVIPARIRELTALQTLRLDTNNITLLPPEIGACTSLVRLQISNNQLTTLPAQISGLHSLQTLILSHNAITSLPSTLWTMTSLEQLRLDYNQLASLPAEVSNLIHLSYLSLNNNLLTTLPVSIRQSAALDTVLQLLEINNNQICPSTLNALDPTFVPWLDKRAEVGWETTQGTCP